MKTVEQKTCFVIMGFGKKKDPTTNRIIDLDETYKQIIRPAVQECNYKCVRADEISDSGIIDRSMYALLYRADLVIADISTYNPNAIYELGTRHVLKKSVTIIMQEDKGKIPFDVSHNRILLYKHSGNKIYEQEAKKSIRELKELIIAIENNAIIDSPLYSFFPNTQPPVILDKELEEIISEIRTAENSVYALMDKAKEDMAQNRFAEAAKKWRQLSGTVKNEVYFIQQEALCTYKSESPNKLNALTDALQIIGKIANQTDTETLGIAGAINKRLWAATKEKSYLLTAIDFYRKGWYAYQDYYTGENYANCMEQRATLESDGKYKTWCLVEAQEVRKGIIEVVASSLENTEPEELKWKYATLANCYLSINHTDKSKYYEMEFRKQKPETWEIDTFERSKQNIINAKKQEE
jgi:vacuolar-type H+-ATPase subunit H